MLNMQIDVKHHNQDIFNDPGVYNQDEIPALSQERRSEMIKYSHQIIEDGKISIRNVRRDGIHQLHLFGKEEKISEDLIKDNEALIQKETDKFTSILDELQSEKEAEVLEI